MNKTSFTRVASALLLAGAGAVAAAAITPVADSPLMRKAPVNKFSHTTVTSAMKGMQRVTAGPSAPGVSAALRSQARTTAGGTALYGYLTAGRGGNDHGWYRFDNNGFTLQWSDPLFSYDYGYGQLNSVWVRNGKVCGFEHWFQYGYFWGQEYYELDLSNGMIVKDETSEDCIDKGWFINACYDSDEDMVYGYGTDDEEESATALFMKTPGNNVFDYQIIKDYGDNAADYNKQCLSMCYNPVDKKLYGINIDRQFVTVDKTTGNQTVLFTIDRNLGLYVTGLAYSPVEDLFYWNYQYDKEDGSWGSDLCTINARTHEIKTVESYPGGDAFSAFFVIGQSFDAAAPKRPELKSADFPDGATSGSLTYTLPTQATNGTALTGSLDWELKVDRWKKASGQAAPGADVKVELSDISTGMHTFHFSVSQNGAESPVLSTEMYIGSDRPKAPESVVLDDKRIRWSAVTEGVNGGYLDAAQVKYKVYLNDELLTTTSRTLYEYTLPADAPVQKWVAKVIAVCNDISSAPTTSNSIVAGAPWQLPVSLECTPEMLELMTVVNANGDDETWTYSYWDKGWYSGQVDEGTGDDWIFLPAIHFPDASRNYSFYMDAMRKANIYPDTWLEVKIGDYPSPEMMNRTIMERFSAQSRDYKEYSNPIFTVPEAGDYYIGIHCISNVDMCGSIIGAVRVRDDNVQAHSPAAVENLTAAAGANGALEANVSFRMPVKYVNGDNIPAGSVITAKVMGDNTVSVTGAPGAEVTATVRTLQGDNEITVRTSLDDIEGLVAVTRVYTGVSVPGVVKNLTAEIAPDMMSVSMAWEAPDAETAGGYVDPATTSYYFAIMDPVAQEYQFSLAGKGVYSGTFTLPAGWEQDLYRIGVVAENEAGRSSQLMRFETVLGPAHQLPMVEDFESGNFAKSPWVNYGTTSSTVSWGLYQLRDIATEWADLTTVALVGYTRTAGTADEGMIGLPRFTTKGNNVINVKLKYWAGDQAAKIFVKGATHSSDTDLTIGECQLSTKYEWLNAEFQLPASMMNLDWGQVYINPVFGENMNYCIIEEIVIDGDVTGLIANISPEGTVSAGDGFIEFRGYAGETAEIYTPSGALYARQSLSGDSCRVAVTPGIYMVKLPAKTAKLFVK